MAYEAEGNGNLIQDMVPNPKLAMTQQSQGSKVELEAHTEQCFSDHKPDDAWCSAHCVATPRRSSTPTRLASSPSTSPTKSCATCARRGG